MNLGSLKEALSLCYKYDNQYEWIEGNQLVKNIENDIFTLMLERNKTVEAEIKKPNSSTALALNYFELLSSVQQIRIDYEYPIGYPLSLKHSRGHKAIIDVHYTLDDAQYYIESKFLEPYYSCTKHISESYLKEFNYPTDIDASAWIDLFIRIERDNYHYIDINQMAKHLLAIYRKRPKAFIVLKCMIWKPTDSFLDAIKKPISKSYLQERIKTITSEMQRSQKLLNNFARTTLHWENCIVEFVYYNDNLDDISSHALFRKFKRKYLF